MSAAEYVAVWLEGTAVFSAASLVSARYLYGRLRARRVDWRAKKYLGSDPVYMFNKMDRTQAIAIALTLSVATWPVVLPVVWFTYLSTWAVKFMERTSVKSEYEKGFKK